MMAVDRHTLEDYLKEVEGVIRGKFPDAEFAVVRLGRKEAKLYVKGDFSNLFEVLDLVSERTTDILVESGTQIHLVPLKRKAAAVAGS